MRVNARIGRLEERLGSAECAECHGLGRMTISQVYEDAPPPTVPGCAACGQVFHVILRYRTRPILHEQINREANGDGV
jgi:hypothetical protein